MKFTWSYQEQNTEPKKYSEEWYEQENKRLKDLFYKETNIKPGTKITEEDIKKYWNEFERIGLYQGVIREALKEILLED